MPVRSSLVGSLLGEQHVTCDARWLMAYASGLGLDASIYFDTARDGGVTVHPLFPVAPEWPLLNLRTTAVDFGLTRDEARRGVHAGHALTWHRPLQQDLDVRLSGAITGVESTRAGARVTARLDAVDPGASDEPIWTTDYITVYRGVVVDGPDIVPGGGSQQTASPTASRDTGDVLDRRDVRIPANAAHVYTECARIWNPIHTDIRTATAAGLPGLVLHGTATLAHGITATLDMIGADPRSVTRVGGSFRAMVLMPSTLTVELVGVTQQATETVAEFAVRTEQGGLAVENGFVAVVR